MRILGQKVSFGLCAFVLTIGRVNAIDFAGGTGEPNDPYQITTVEQLIGVGEYSDRHFVLISDIDMDPNRVEGRVFTDAVIHSKRGVGRGRSGGSISVSLGFTGTMDGAGHKIRNLHINIANSWSDCGLFDFVAEEGIIRGVHLDDVAMTCATSSSVGILTSVNYGTVVDCSIAGLLLCQGQANAVGTLIGDNLGTIRDCDSSCVLSYTGGGASVGGLVGINHASSLIIGCRVKGDVFCDGQWHGELYAGGLVGLNKGTIWSSSAIPLMMGNYSQGGLVGNNYGEIYGCFAQARIFSTASMVGGLVASNQGHIRYSYARGLVHGGRDLGGLVGVNTHKGVLSCCYNKAKVMLMSYDHAGGLVGDNQGVIFSCYTAGTVISPVYSESAGGRLVGTCRQDARILASYFLDPEDGGDVHNCWGAVLTRDEMQERSSFLGWDFYGSDEDGSLDEWFMSADGLPVLTMQREVGGLFLIPPLIGVSLDKARILLQDADLKLGDISYDWDSQADADTVAHVTSGLWAAPGSAVNVVVSLGSCDWSTWGEGTLEQPYRLSSPGQLACLHLIDGDANSHFVLERDIDLQGRVFHHAFFSDPPSTPHPRSGFSGVFDGGGFVLQNGHFRIMDSRAGVFGHMDHDAIIQHLGFDAIHVWGYEDVGLLAGHCKGRVVQCWGQGTVFGNICVGGLVGETSPNAMIQNCYTKCQVTGSCSVGGFIGYVIGSTVETSYAMGPVQVVEDAPTPHCHHSREGVDVGALVGRWDPGVIRRCYFLDLQNSSGIADNGLGIGLSEIQMQDQAAFQGFDFWGTPTDGHADHWFMPQEGTPILSIRTEETGLTCIPSLAGYTWQEAERILVASGFSFGEAQTDFHRSMPRRSMLWTEPRYYQAVDESVSLILSSGSYDWSSNPGDGSTDNPYQIQRASQLDSLSDYPDLFSRSFVLTDDIDMGDYTYASALITIIKLRPLAV